jgi:cytochrome b
MFQIGVVEQVRLSYESIQAACEGHAEAAARLARLSSYARLGTLGAVAIAAVLSAVALQGGRGWQIAAAVFAACAFVTCAAYVGVNQQARIYGHRVSAARLWVVCEKYRGLLAEMHEQLIELTAVHDRRNALVQEAATVFEQAPPEDRYTFEIARRALRGAAAHPAAPAPANPV